MKALLVGLMRNVIRSCQKYDVNPFEVWVIAISEYRKQQEGKK